MANAGVRGRPIVPLVLSAQERAYLERQVRRHRVARSLSERCRVILRCADGLASKDVAAELGLHEHTVGKWRRRFLQVTPSYTGQPLRELIIEGANTVLNSPYARIFGMPLSYFGLVYYSYMFGLAALLALKPSSRGLRLGALLYAGMGVLSSIYFMYIQLNFIQAGACADCPLTPGTPPPDPCARPAAPRSP